MLEHNSDRLVMAAVAIVIALVIYAAAKAFMPGLVDAIGAKLNEVLGKSVLPDGGYQAPASAQAYK